MIDVPLLRRLMLLTGVLLVLSAGAALAVGRSTALAGGLALGFALGALPFASWAWIASRGLATRRNRVIAALIVLSKLGLYSGGLYLLVTRDVVNPIGVLAGLTGAVLVVSVGALVGAPPRPKEAA
jgi:hypothetical protein